MFLFDFILSAFRIFNRTKPGSPFLCPSAKKTPFFVELCMVRNSTTTTNNWWMVWQWRFNYEMILFIRDSDMTESAKQNGQRNNQNKTNDHYQHNTKSRKATERGGADYLRDIQQNTFSSYKLLAHLLRLHCGRFVWNRLYLPKMKWISSELRAVYICILYLSIHRGYMQKFRCSTMIPKNISISIHLPKLIRTFLFCPASSWRSFTIFQLKLFLFYVFQRVTNLSLVHAVCVDTYSVYTRDVQL